MTKKLPSKTYLVSEIARTFEVEASTEREAISLVRSYGYAPTCPNCEGNPFACGCVVEFQEPDTVAEFLSCAGCPECESSPFGYHGEEVITTNRRTLERLKAETVERANWLFANQLHGEINRTLARLEKQESNLRSWLEGTRGENSPAEEKADKERLDFLAGQIEAFQTVKAYLRKAR